MRKIEGDRSIYCYYEMRLDTTYMMKERERLTTVYLGFSGICLVGMLTTEELGERLGG